MIYQDIVNNNGSDGSINQCFKLVSEKNDAQKSNLFLPDGLISVLFLKKGSFYILNKNKKSSYHAPALMIAFFTEPQSVYFEEDTMVYGQTFYPWMINAMGTNCAALKDQLIPIDFIFPVLQDRLLSELICLKDQNQIPVLINQMIFNDQRPVLPVWVENFTKEAVEAKGQIKITSYLPKISVSERNFQTHFFNTFGITAKHYCDLCKFNYSKVLMEKMNHLNLAAIAQYAGYCDQSHFIRHFKKFSGHSPKVLRKEDIGMGKFFGMYQKRAAGF
ncbi:MAG: helix-turn-helix domain-containing protein [Candidatus Cyclobacteriaceae bacterium M3_2C_046]